jgi:DNA-binding transcriptional MerR regulator
MDKSPEAFRTISEVAEALDVPPHVLRFWETRFTQVKPVKRGGGRRYYRPEDVRLLRGIRGLLYDDGMTIKGVQKILRERGLRHVIGLGTLPSELEPAPVIEPVVAPAPRPVRERAAPSVAPQRDLFDAGTAVAEVVETMTSTTETTASEARARPLDRAALRGLVAKLQALRAVMIEEPGRKAR